MRSREGVVHGKHTSADGASPLKAAKNGDQCSLTYFLRIMAAECCGLRHQVTGKAVGEGRILICLNVISSSWVVMIRLRARPASGDFSSSLSRSSAVIRVLASGERVEDKHWISSSSAMVWEKGTETRPNASRSRITSKIHPLPCTRKGTGHSIRESTYATQVEVFEPPALPLRHQRTSATLSRALRYPVAFRPALAQSDSRKHQVHFCL